jgi:predicted DNA-binding transcriptional regulator YafY
VGPLIRTLATALSEPERLEVTHRTVRRDIDRLRELG